MYRGTAMDDLLRLMSDEVSSRFTSCAW